MATSKLNLYVSLVKPRVLQGNVITGIAGYLLAAGHFHHFRVGLFVATIVGMTLVIASACSLNNYLDRDIDKLMERTKERAMAAGRLPGSGAVIFSAALWIVGMAILIVWVNLVVVIIGLVGFIVYVWLYGALSKRRSIHGTLVGSISGAAPVVAGYCAVADKIDATAIVLFLALFFWQFAEFYSIAIYRRKEYKAAGVPIMTVIKGVRSTTVQIFIYTLLYVAATLTLSFMSVTGWVYFVVMTVFGLGFIRLGYNGLRLHGSDKWARKMFHYSLLNLMIFSLMLSVGSLLP
jgi:protoheme IX farnesyltransferase